MQKKVWVVASWNKWSKEFQYDVWTFKPEEDSGVTLVCEKEIEFESLGEAALKQGIYNAMMAKRKTVLADAYAEATELEAMANELLAIDFKPTKVTVEADNDIPF